MSEDNEADRGGRQRVVIVGAGFAGLTAAKALARTAVDITVVDRNNYHLFQPLLYQVATAALSPAQIAQPIRGILRGQRNVTIRMSRVTGIDKAQRLVLSDDAPLPYDWLIVSTGARHAYFGHDDWEAHAPGLKKIEDATAIRRRILTAFEDAEKHNRADQVPSLNFVVIGGGPTGVEMAGAIAELARHALAKDFRNIDPLQTRVLLIESGSRLLSTFPESLSAHAKASLEKLGVTVLLGNPVTECDASGVTVGAESIASECVIWAAGVAASPAAKWLDAEKDRAGRVKVNPDLTLPGHPNIFVVGDTALVLDEAGRPVPGVAPAAKQQGRFAADSIHAAIEGRSRQSAFRYRNAGNLATVGRRSAVVDFGWLRMSGLMAWLLWGAAHIFFLIGFRNRISVLVDWIWSYLTFQRGARLITRSDL